MAIIISPNINPALKASSIKPQPDRLTIKNKQKDGRINFFIDEFFFIYQKLYL